MQAVVSAIVERKLLWLLVLVPVLLAVAPMMPDRHSLLFVLSVLAIVPLAALLSLATEQVAARTGDAIGGLLNATLGNLTELIIGLTALRAGGVRNLMPPRSALNRGRASRTGRCASLNIARS